MGDRLVHIGAAPNYCTLPQTVITSGPTPGGDFGQENLRSEDPSESIRLAGGADDLWIGFDFGESLRIGMMNLVAHNLSGDDKLRFRASEFPIGGAALLPPAVIVSQQNMTGGIAEIDDNPHSPDALAWSVDVPGNSTAAVVRFDVAPLGGAHLTGGDGLQVIHVLVQRQGGPAASLEVALLVGESGGPPAKEVARGEFEGEDGDKLLVSGYLSAGDLVDPTGADLELHVECSGKSGASLTIAAVGWEAYSGATEYDTGLIGVPFSAGDPLWSDSVPPPTMWGQAYANHIPLDAPVARHVRIDFQRRSRGGDVEVGVVNLSPAFTPSKAGHTAGPLVSVVDPSDRGRTKGQQEFGSSALVLAKRLQLHLPTLTFREGVSLFQRLDLSKGRTGAVIVVPYPDGSLETQQATTVYGTLSDPDSRPLEVSSSPAHLAKDLEVIERTGGGPR